MDTTCPMKINNDDDSVVDTIPINTSDDEEEGKDVLELE